MTNHEELLTRLDAWLGIGDSDTADFLRDMRDAATAIRGLTAELETECGVREEAELRQAEAERDVEKTVDEWDKYRLRAEAAEAKCLRLKAELRRACDQHEGAAAKWQEADAKLAAVEAVLKECQRIPVMPFPDPGAHSWQAYGTAVFRAWSQIRQKIDIALKPTAAAQVGGTDSLVHSANGPAPAAAHEYTWITYLAERETKMIVPQELFEFHYIFSDSPHAVQHLLEHCINIAKSTHTVEGTALDAADAIRAEFGLVQTDEKLEKLG